ncbi:unnamed protein product [Caenorhabditis bovis]|uniref:Ubiquitin-like protease family profile domain-containing protein n=1 Tax=Caenorhabditis bovis TaxID=2654633 RepID=A0A8S1F3B5_9PELO|nr:unnamed protein product [Caenorhabditis bovis]
MLDDVQIDFYLNYWIWNVRYNEERRSRTFIHDTFAFTILREKIAKNLPPKPKVLDFKKKWPLIFKKQKADLFEKEFWVFPIHLKEIRHWTLVIVHNPGAAIRKYKHTFGKDCRILLMDSLTNHPKYREYFAIEHPNIMETIKNYLQLLAASYGYSVLKNRIKSVICSDITQQENCVDCGIHLLVNVEYFTYFNTLWTACATKDLHEMRHDVDIEFNLKTGKTRKDFQELFTYLKTNPIINI